MGTTIEEAIDCSIQTQADVASRRGLHALAINQDTVRNTRLTGRDLFKELEAGEDVRIAVMTPAMLNEADMKALLRWARRNLSKRLHLPAETCGVIWAAATAIATPAEAVSMVAALGFHPNKYINARYSVGT
ncbi:hypothetical protein R3P38DRAFT_3239504 [Favolaschia claudopus]|uniref:Uncharacterized protein n=1 Tax=Favolaschia claudopus TaxID=2862362 RepID=A0AAV9Z8I9_9AGAR